MFLQKSVAYIHGVISQKPKIFSAPFSIINFDINVKQTTWYFASKIVYAFSPSRNAVDILRNEISRQNATEVCQ